MLYLKANHSKRWEQVSNILLPPISLSGLIDHGNNTVPCAVLNATEKANLPSHYHKTRLMERISPQTVRKNGIDIMETTQLLKIDWYWICHDKAWNILPVDKAQLCALGAVIPNIIIIDHIENPNGRRKVSINPLTEYF